MLAKKTAWSIGNARKKGKKSAKITAASKRGNAGARGFQVTKEKLAKALGEMSVADALTYLSGPEPRRAGISDTVVNGLKKEITDAAEAAKAEAAKDNADPASGAAAMSGPDGDSEEAMRKWREYCAEAIAAAEAVDQAASHDAEEVETPAANSPSTTPPSLDAVPRGDIPLFKPREESSEPDTVAPDAVSGEYAPAQEMY